MLRPSRDPSPGDLSIPPSPAFAEDDRTPHLPPPRRLISRGILVVDDHPLLRQGVIRVLADEPDLEVVGEVATVEEALDQGRSLEPELVILDLGLAGSDGLHAIPRLRRSGGNPCVLVLSVFDEMVYAERCLRAGAGGYLMKEEASHRLVRAIRTVLAGEVWVSRAVRNQLARRLAGTVREGPAQKLTDRELQVFRMLGEGRSTREIAEALSLSVKTIETHRAKVMRKLALENATQLLHRAVSWVQETRRTP